MVTDEPKEGAATDPCNIRVVIFDDDERELETYEKHFREVLKDVGFSADIRMISTGSPAQDAQNLDAQLHLRPHLLVLDNRFDSKRQNEGLKLIALRKDKHPDTVFVLLSKERIRVEQLGMNWPVPDIIVSKLMLRTPKYREYIGSVLSKRIQRACVMRVACMIGNTQITIREEDQTYKKDLTEDHLRSMVEQLLFTGGPRPDQKAKPLRFDYALLKPLDDNADEVEAGKSGAVVGKLELGHSGGALGVSPVGQNWTRKPPLRGSLLRAISHARDQDCAEEAREGRIRKLQSIREVAPSLHLASRCCWMG